MTSRNINFDYIAALLGRTVCATDEERAALRRTPVFAAGYGSITRPLLDSLAADELQTALLADPKSYNLRSTASQCSPAEVGRKKVDVGVERLRVRGVDATAFARDLYYVPDGVLHEQTIVVAGLDNRRADIRANRMALSMGARLIKINIEPALQVVSVRAFDFRKPTTVCAECQFRDWHYEKQRHPRSCDGPGSGRSTNSPRWLSHLAARIGSWAVCDVAVDADRAERWYRAECMYWHETQRFTASQLVSHPYCRCDHSRRWPNIQHLAAGPERLQLGELMRDAGAASHGPCRLRFCQQISMRGRCRDCGLECHQPRWLADPDRPIGTCHACDGGLEAIPFCTHSELDAGQMSTVIDQPLSCWGVEPYALIEISSRDHATTFAVGNESKRTHVN